MTKLDLSMGYMAKIDDIDAARCLEVKWWARMSKGRVWAMSRLGPLHKYITGWKRVGFVNDNSLDCRRENLFEKKRVIGVYAYPLSNGRWRINVGNHTVGTADTEEQAMQKGWDMLRRAK